MTSTVQPGAPAAVEPRVSRFARKPRITEDVKPAHWSIKLGVVIICFLWIVPAFGALVTSFRSEADANSSGWWTVFNPANWGGFTLTNYHDALVNAGLGQAFINSF